MIDWRNPAFNALGSIDVEIEHPVHGWIPFTAAAGDTGADPAVGDVQDLLAAIVAAGNIAPYVPPPDPVPTVPAEISKVQLKRATEAIEHAPGVTLWQAIKAAIATADEDTQEEWGLISDLPRNHPTVVALAQALGKSSAEMDAVWIAGKAL